MGFLRPLERLRGVFQSLLGMLVPGLVVFFSMMRGGSAVRVCRKFVELGGPLVRVRWHVVFLSSVYVPK
jgi:hypothetical protein